MQKITDDNVLADALTIPPALVDRIRQSDREGQDLLEADRRASEERNMRAHVRRVWEHLNGAEREEIRELVRKQKVLSEFDTHLLDVEYDCLRCVEIVLKE